MIINQNEGSTFAVIRKCNIGTSIKSTAINVMVGNRSAASSQDWVDSTGNAGNLFIPHSLGPPMV